VSDWSGRQALVTGASGAIGAAVARRLAAAGVRVALCGRDVDRLHEAARSLPLAGELLAADFTAGEELAALLARARDAFAELDLLVHAAGLLEPGNVEESTLEALDRQWSVHLRAPWELTRALLPALRRSRGQIAFVNSSVTARPGLAGYAATKSAQRAFADCLRQEVNRDGVRVLSVFPGRTASAMLESFLRHRGEPWEPERLMRPDDVAQALVAALELPRSAAVTEIHLRPMQPPA